ncbi:hypothetical protein [Streptomyces longispororuber]|uniref:hypothetical protein n=1 Tax=Streptomyces longispororuber TaxID=68230 RepID=UPI00210C9969|nr:hypothetical protein [Streptomyces longispororuber]MCQ4205756.1 hypothetical protein [Streptomyces longispororuber]
MWDKSTDDWKVFWFNKCATYSLSNWEGPGPYFNNQTGGRAVASFYRRDGSSMKNVSPGDDGWWDWSPVWKIRNCY